MKWLRVAQLPGRDHFLKVAELGGRFQRKLWAYYTEAHRRGYGRSAASTPRICARSGKMAS